MNIKDESQYLERTPDLVAKVRAVREEMQKLMDRLTRVEDYDVCRCVGHGPKPQPAPEKILTSSPSGKPVKPSVVQEQTAIEFGDGESA